MSNIKRIVLFRFKAGTPDKTINKIFGDLKGLKDKIPGINDFAYGPYSSSDGLNQGYTHAFIMTFKDAASRDGFGPHPEHQRVVSTLGPHLETVLAFDFFV